MRRPSKHRKTTMDTGQGYTNVLPGNQPGDTEIAFWRELKEDVNANDEKLNWTKKLFVTGLSRLVSQGRYHPRVLENMVAVSMVRLFEDPGDENLAMHTGTHGYLAEGYRSEDPHEIAGRFINVRTLDNTGISVHELGHVTFGIGEIADAHILREPIVNRAAKDVMHEMGQSSDLGEFYQPHEQVLDMIMEVSRLDFRDITYITSGPDSVENDMILRQAVIDRTGRDYVGYAQSQYLGYLDQSAAASSEGVPDQYEAARGVVLDLGYYLNPSQPAFSTT